MPLSDITSLTDEQLDELRIVAATEQERRARMRQVPADIAASARRYVADGGDLAEITSALAEVAPGPE